MVGCHKIYGVRRLYGEEWVSFFGKLGFGLGLKLWLAHMVVSGNDICDVVEALLPGRSRNWPPWHEHSELGAALFKAVWWDLRLVSTFITLI